MNDSSGEFALRALTRDPGKDAAKVLADAGGEVVQADLDDETSLERAFQGAYGAYCLTNFWEHFSGEKETTQGGNTYNPPNRSIKWVPLKENRQQGGIIRTFFGRYHILPGDKFYVQAGA